MADSALLLSSTVSITLAQTSAPVCPDQCKTKRRMIENFFIALYATPHFVASPHLFMVVCMQAWGGAFPASGEKQRWKTRVVENLKRRVLNAYSLSHFCSIFNYLPFPLPLSLSSLCDVRWPIVSRTGKGIECTTTARDQQAE